MSDSSEQNQNNSSINDSYQEGVDTSSIYFEDNEIKELLSKIIYPDSNTTSQNEFVQPYEKSNLLTDDQLKSQFNESKIKPTENQLKSNLTEAQYSKLKSQANEIKNEDDSDLYLKTEDYPKKLISDDFYYLDAVDEIKSNISTFERELKAVNVVNLSENSIYKGKTVEEMVEQTYCYDNTIKNQMIEEVCYLKRIICCWRRVAGDGNCFYRSAIFSWLEYLIFNKKENVFRIIISNIFAKFNPGYVNTKRLNINLQKQFINKEKQVTLTILEIIVRLLNKNDIKEAYLTLLKAFNASRAFDRTMIFYLRYLLYEYILENENKLFSKDFPVLLGNLLPEEYETNDGKFLFENYFMNDLLKYYTCAEKLAVYLTPYVLKCNLNIVFYYFGKDCDIENKFFQCGLNKDKEKDTINVLFRKAHYDACYTNKFYKDSKDLLELYCNLKLDNNNVKVTHVVDINSIYMKTAQIDDIDPFDPQKSIIFNRELFKKKLQEMKKKQIENGKKAKEINNSFDETFIACILNSHNQNNCFICSNNANVTNDSFSSVLQCGCKITFCSDKCKELFYKYLTSFLQKINFDASIKCGRCNKEIERTKLIQFTDISNNEVKTALKNKMLEFFDKYCMNCLEEINEKSEHPKKVMCKCQNLGKVLDNNKFEHKVCQNCKKNYTGNCKICDLYHSRLLQ